MVKCKTINIDAVRACLIQTQEHFDAINATLSVRRTPPSDEIIENLVAGYEQVNDYLLSDIDLFEMGHSGLLLELNHIVLYHHGGLCSEEKDRQFKATEQHFYSSELGGIDEFMTWLRVNKTLSLWKTAAGAFTHMLSQPQLFLEGNHRTGSLIMSYLLVRGGYGPFVLSVENAKHFFEPAEIVKSRHKNLLLDEYLHLPKQTRKFSKLLKQEQSAEFLVDTCMESTGT